MTKLPFRIKPYSHRKYKFVVRAKLEGKWRRSYFESEDEATEYARRENASSEQARRRGEEVVSSGSPALVDGLELTRSRPSRRVARQKAAVVLGMHRSGTSALGGALSRLGVDFGQHLTPAASDNEKGYWEHPEIVAIHDELFRALNSRWDDDKPLPLGWVDTDVAVDTQSLLLGILQRDFQHAKIFGLKDPRMCRLMPLWLRIFDAARIEPCFILAIRHPFEVAESLAKRNGLEHAKSYLLWLGHTLDAERATRSYKRSFVCYDAFVRDPTVVLERIRKRLALDFRSPLQVRAALRQFVEPSMRHHDSSQQPLPESHAAMPPLALEVFETIRQWAGSNKITEKIAPLSSQFALSAEMFYPRVAIVERELSALDAKVPIRDDTSGDEQLVRLEVFFPTGDGYHAAESLTRYFATGSWKLLSIDLPGRQQGSEQPFRIDPVSYPAIVDIAEIALRHPTSGELVWGAANKREFDSFHAAGTACRLDNQRYLRLFSFGGDPQLLLPPGTAALTSSPLRLELSIRVDGSTEAIASALAQSKDDLTPVTSATPLISIFADQGNGYRSEASLVTSLKLGVRQTICFPDIQRLRPDMGGRWRIDPIDQPGVLNISNIRIIRDSNEDSLYNAERLIDFQRIECSEGMLSNSSEGALLLVVTGADPQIFLPPVDLPATGSCRMEITLEPHAAPSFVISAMTAWKGTFDELTTALEASQSEIGRQGRALEDAAAAAAGSGAESATQLHATKISLEASKAEVAARLQATETSLEAAQAEVLRQAQALRDGAAELQGWQARIAPLETAVATWQRTFADLQASFDANQAELGRTIQHLKVKEAQIKTLQNAVAETHARWGQLTAELTAERSENRELRERARALEAALQSAIEQARAENRQHRERVQALEATSQSAIERANAEGIIQRTRREDLDAQVALDAEQIAGFENEVRDLSVALELARGQWSQLAAELRTAQYQNGELQAQTELDAEQITLLETQLYHLETAIHEGRAQMAQMASNLAKAHFENCELQAQTELDAEQIEALEGSRSDAIRLAAELEMERSAREAEKRQLRQTAEQKLALERELAGTRAALSHSRDQAERLSGALELGKSRGTGLERFNAHLERRLEDVSQQMRVAAEVLKRGDPEIPGIIDLILEDIRRIHNPSFWWKAARALGILRLSHAGVPRTAEERRSLARELKAGLREICQALSSPATVPEEAAAEIPRLLQLRRQTRELLQSVELSGLLRTKSPIWQIVHWARRTASGFSSFSGASALFDAAWYLEQNRDVATSKADPLKHYLRWGAREGRDPNPLFDCKWYLQTYSDVAATDINPLKHFWEFGALEGRDPNPLFSVRWYLQENPDVAAAGLNPLQHYLEHGAKEGRDPHPLFHTAWYLEQNPEAAGFNPLEHYLRWGKEHGRSPHLLFEAAWYLEQYRDLAEGRMDPLRHYFEYGASEGRDPHPLFDSKWYLRQLGEVVLTGTNPLQHYVLMGAKERRSPHPMFDPRFYLENCPEASSADDLLWHYLTVGWRNGHRPCASFDPQAYLREHPDVAALGIEPLTHFVRQSRLEQVPKEAPFQFHLPDFEIPREPQRRLDRPALDLKAIAFYLPQFHRISENDTWWGEGFTEWRNVRRGRPNFAGHYQPHVPTALGYYDLEHSDALERQAELARSHGLYGFCFYYYWFAGKVLLDLPVRRLAETGQPDMPFCICWANENWTRRWDGRDDDILIAQDHSPEDDLAFIRQIEPILLSNNYIRVGGKPLLGVYRPSLLPNAAATVERWRAYFRKRGHGELHLVMMRSFTEVRPELYGFDAIIQFPPHCHATAVTPLIEGKDSSYSGRIYNYLELRQKFLEELRHPPEGLKLYPGVMPSWDNTARQMDKSSIWINSSPEAYFEWLSATAELVRKKPDSEERLIFINAWNEWAEGCHLEPDERYGHAWLNATSRALQGAPSQADELAAAISHPEPPIQAPIVIAPLSASLKLAISVLFYHREDIIPSFLRSLLPQIRALNASHGTELYLAFNYKPTAALQAEVRGLLAQILPEGSKFVHFVENGFNVGFGLGHNAVFAQSESDIFLMLNSDVRIAQPDWLATLVERFRTSDAAIVGLAATASRLREDGCGIPIVPGEQDFDFVDGSVLAVRSDLARRYGLFSDAFDYFYFEDADLCLRYRQLGLRLDLLDLPYEHDRSSSSRLLPQYAMESVLNRNRAKFFQRWEHYLRTREIPNRLAVRFLDIDRQLQCASLPGIFGLLSEHPGAILDLSGVHEQLAPFFQHPRLRLIPSWQTLRKNDYLRFYDVGRDLSQDEPRVADIAKCFGCKPDVDAVRVHLRSLCHVDKKRSSRGLQQALLFVPRMEPLFEGRQPQPDSFGIINQLLLKEGWQVALVTNLGRFELEALSSFSGCEAVFAGASSGLEILGGIIGSDLVVSGDSWISELGQLLDKKTFVWLGATASSRSLWNLAKVGFFSDRSLPCLGCYHRFGRDHRNTCLRGDIACMRSELADEAGAALLRFLEGAPLTAAQLEGDQLLTAESSRHSTVLRLDYWPASRAASVLVLIPINPKLRREAIERARTLAERAIGGMQGCRVVLDEEGISPPRGVPHPARQQAMAEIRQAMVDRHLNDERWVFWVDADIADYPATLIDELISRVEGGIAAPIVLMEGDVSEPLSNKFGFGPGRFYDVAGFVENGHWARFTQPFFDQPGPVYQLDSVGSCYLVNADLYRQGARHEMDFASRIFVEDNCDWPEDSIARNQLRTANCFSEHYSVCEFTRQAGLPVRAFADLVALHEKPAAT